MTFNDIQSTPLRRTALVVFSPYVLFFVFLGIFATAVINFGVFLKDSYDLLTDVWGDIKDTWK